MFVYKFEKGTIKTGVEMNHIVEGANFFKRDFGEFLHYSNEDKHCNEDLEVVYVYTSIPRDEFDEEHELVLVKDASEILQIKESGRYELACMDFVLDMCENPPINFYSSDGLVSLVKEEYISDTEKSISSNKHICVSL